MVPTAVADEVINNYKQARKDFDDYYAVVVMGDSMGQWWQASQLYRVWRSGLRWRIEQVMQTGPSLRQVPDNNDRQTEWWMQRATDLPFRPVELSDGRDCYRFRDGRWQKVRPVSKENPYSTLPHVMPEFIGRPFLHALHPGAEIMLNPELSKGPAGTVFLSAARTGRSRDQTTPNFYRYPNRSSEESSLFVP